LSARARAHARPITRAFIDHDRKETGMAQKDLASMEAELTAWASEWGVTYQRGEVGFGRQCVGFIHDESGSYVDLYETDANWLPVDRDLERITRPAPDVPDAYHKHDCLAVLVHGEDLNSAVRQLHTWVEALRSDGLSVKVVPRLTMDVSALLGARTVAVLSR
jgi:hypothetical protein